VGKGLGNSLALKPWQFASWRKASFAAFWYFYLFCAIELNGADRTCRTRTSQAASKCCIDLKKRIFPRSINSLLVFVFQGDLPRFQRPVSFTDVDNRFTEHSSLSRSSLEGSLERSKSKKLEQGRLVLNSGPRDQPDVINATPHAINPFEHYDSETPQRWLPDELSLEKQGPRGTRNNWLARPKVYLNVDDASTEHGAWRNHCAISAENGDEDWAEASAFFSDFFRAWQLASKS